MIKTQNQISSARTFLNGAEISSNDKQAKDEIEKLSNEILNLL